MPDQLDDAGTGIAGLDRILAGGLARGSLFLIEGEPGSGKTTAALQFLMTGADAGEETLYITLSESERELRSSAASHGWTLGDRVAIYELTPPESMLDGGPRTKACSIPPIWSWGGRPRSRSSA